MKAINTSKKVNEKKLFNNIQGKKKKPKPRFQLGNLNKTADIKAVFINGDRKNHSYELYTINEVIHDKFFSHRIN